MCVRVRARVRSCVCVFNLCISTINTLFVLSVIGLTENKYFLVVVVVSSARDDRQGYVSGLVYTADILFSSEQWNFEVSNNNNNCNTFTVPYH